MYYLKKISFVLGQAAPPPIAHTSTSSHLTHPRAPPPLGYNPPSPARNLRQSSSPSSPQPSSAPLRRIPPLFYHLIPSSFPCTRSYSPRRTRRKVLGRIPAHRPTPISGQLSQGEAPGAVRSEAGATHHHRWQTKSVCCRLLTAFPDRHTGPGAYGLTAIAIYT